MSYSSKKPYQRKYVSVKEFYSLSSRFLKGSPQHESEFEKPYLQPEYQDMHQTWNPPKIPPVGGGGLL